MFSEYLHKKELRHPMAAISQFRGRVEKVRLIAIAIAMIILAASHVVPAAEIHEAVTAQDIAKVKQLLTTNPDFVNAITSDGFTPLHLAAASNNTELVTLLLEKGADINAETKDGCTALQVAINKKAIAAVKLLVSNTASVYSNRFLDTRFPENEIAIKTGDMERAYEIFADLLREYPSNEKINFAYGLACFSLKENSRARLAFERVLQINPENHRGRVELGRAYLASGQLQLAGQQFETALSYNPPESVRRNIESYLEQIRKRINRWQFSGRVDAGAFDDDNVNVGPDSEIISITPIIFGATTISAMTIEESSRPVEASGLFSAVALSGSYDTGEQANWVITTDVSYYQNWLDDEPDYESLYYQAAAGLRHTGARSTLSLPLKVTHITSGHDPLVNMYGISPSYLYVYGPQGDWHWLTAGTVEFRDYDELNDHDSFYLAANETVCRYFGKRGHNISMCVSLFHDHTDAAVYEYIGIASSLGGEMKLPWKSALYARVRHVRADYAERETLAPEKRSDAQNQFVAGITKMFARQWGMDVNYQATDNNSTYGLYQYDRNVATISAFCAF